MLIYYFFVIIDSCIKTLNDDMKIFLYVAVIVVFFKFIFMDL